LLFQIHVDTDSLNRWNIQLVFLLEGAQFLLFAQIPTFCLRLGGLMCINTFNFHHSDKIAWNIRAWFGTRGLRRFRMTFPVFYSEGHNLTSPSFVCSCEERLILPLLMSTTAFDTVLEASSRGFSSKGPLSLYLQALFLFSPSLLLISRIREGPEEEYYVDLPLPVHSGWGSYSAHPNVCSLVHNLLFSLGHRAAISTRNSPRSASLI
jgi:hypothetical protein